MLSLLCSCLFSHLPCKATLANKSPSFMASFSSEFLSVMTLEDKCLISFYLFSQSNLWNRTDCPLVVSIMNTAFPLCYYLIKKVKFMARLKSMQYFCYCNKHFLAILKKESFDVWKVVQTSWTLSCPWLAFLKLV